VSYKKQDGETYLPFVSTGVHPLVFFYGIRVAHRFSFLCCPIMCLYLLSSVLWCRLRFPHKNDARFVFTSSCFRRAHVLFTLFVFVCIEWCTAHSVLCFCFVILRLVWPVLSVSLDNPIVHVWLPLLYSLTFISLIFKKTDAESLSI
jgi:hypothetical protein